MSELSKILLTSSLTVLVGTSVYVLGQLISKFVIDPIHEQRKLIGEIGDAMIFYANVYLTNDLNSISLEEKKELSEAQQKYRQLASLLRSRTHLIPNYKFWEIFGLVKRRHDVEEASSELIGLSNQVFSKENFDNIESRRTKIESLLDLNLGG